MLYYYHKQPSYLASLCITAAIEVDELTRGETNNLENLNELYSILKDSRTNDIDEIIFLNPQFYMTIYRAVTKESKKEFTSSTKTAEVVGELELKMRLLESELRDISTNTASKDKLITMESFLVDLSREFSSEVGSHRYSLAG